MGKEGMINDETYADLPISLYFLRYTVIQKLKIMEFHITLSLILASINIVHA
jgi:hypothetical protein